MRDPKRILWLLAKLAIYWQHHPDLRLGQIIANANAELKGNFDVFYLEDAELQQWVEDRLEGQE